MEEVPKSSSADVASQGAKTRADLNEATGNASTAFTFSTTAQIENFDDVEHGNLESADDDLDMTDSEGIKLEETDNQLTSADESEIDPLKTKIGKDGASECLEMMEDGWSKDFDVDSQGQKSQLKSTNVRCIIFGIFVLLLVIGGACVAVFSKNVKDFFVIWLSIKGTSPHDFRFASYYGDHMVLQRTPHKAVIWGFGPMITDNTSVLVHLESQFISQDYWTVVKSTALGGNVWKVFVGPISDSNPFTINATLFGVEGPYTLQLTNVLFGDVWVCAGHNKMQFPVDKLLNISDDIYPNDNIEKIRIFSLFPAKSDIPWQDLRGIQLPWVVPKIPENQTMSTQFPSVCWLFGKLLHSHLQYPIGLVSVSYSDSAIEEWVPNQVLDICGLQFTDSTSRIWNGMVNPLLSMQLFGVIWSQGLADTVGSKANFSCSMIELIRSWRHGLALQVGRAEVKSLGYESANRLDGVVGKTDPYEEYHFPVGIIQLAPRAHPTENPFNSTNLRWQQTAEFGYLPNRFLMKTFLAASIDWPDQPTNNVTRYLYGHKREVVVRLVSGALNIAYGRSSRYKYIPTLTTYAVFKANRSVVLHFSHPVKVIGHDGFEVCCSENSTEICQPSLSEVMQTPNRKWVPSVISSTGPNYVVLSSKMCDHFVVGIRYAWRENPYQQKSCSIYDSSQEHPLSPYIHYRLSNDGKEHKFHHGQTHLF